jgi:hypothetical protein
METGEKSKWQRRTGRLNEILPREGYYLSYNPNKIMKELGLSDPYLDSSMPETAIVIEKDRPDGSNRYLIFRGDRRGELEKIQTLEGLKEYWKEHGGHFWSDSLEDDEEDLTER